jgi:hypothetical protein
VQTLDPVLWEKLAVGDPTVKHRPIYLLKFVDSLTLRHNVIQALNRGEGYHQLKRAVSHANFGKLRFKTEQEQHIWNECSRLLTNAIIYFNALTLSALLATREDAEDPNFKEQLRRISPIAWQHVNFYGHYEFKSMGKTIDLQSLIDELAQGASPFFDFE